MNKSKKSRNYFKNCANVDLNKYINISHITPIWDSLRVEQQSAKALQLHKNCSIGHKL
tara:strand:- start:207 stop:380 length:174 start_codon:yes stop_codon:yes gene_type:complete